MQKQKIMVDNFIQLILIIEDICKRLNKEESIILSSSIKNHKAMVLGIDYDLFISDSSLYSDNFYDLLLEESGIPIYVHKAQMLGSIETTPGGLPIFEGYMIKIL